MSTALTVVVVLGLAVLLGLVLDAGAGRSAALAGKLEGRPMTDDLTLEHWAQLEALTQSHPKRRAIGAACGLIRALQAQVAEAARLLYDKGEEGASAWEERGRRLERAEILRLLLVADEAVGQDAIARAMRSIELRGPAPVLLPPDLAAIHIAALEAEVARLNSPIVAMSAQHAGEASASPEVPHGQPVHYYDGEALICGADVHGPHYSADTVEYVTCPSCLAAISGD